MVVLAIIGIGVGLWLLIPIPSVISLRITKRCQKGYPWNWRVWVPGAHYVDWCWKRDDDAANF